MGFLLSIIVLIINAMAVFICFQNNTDIYFLGMYMMTLIISAVFIVLLFSKKINQDKKYTSLYLFFVLSIMVFIANIYGMYCPVLCRHYLGLNALPILVLIKKCLYSINYHIYSREIIKKIACVYVLFSILPIVICTVIGNPTFLVFSFLGSPISFTVSAILFLSNKYRGNEE